MTENNQNRDPNPDSAVCDQLEPASQRVAAALTQFLQSNESDALSRVDQWTDALREKLPQAGAGLEETLGLLCEQIIPNGLPMARPGCSAYIMTAPVTASMMAKLAAILASPQRLGQTAFHLLERQSLAWLAQMFGLSTDMQGLFTSGGSTANLVALGAARQSAFRKSGEEVAETGVTRQARIFVSAETHRSVQKSAAVLGIGRQNVKVIPCDREGRIDVALLEAAILECREDDICPVAMVANAGATSTGVIDPIADMANLATRYDIWLHVDGAYGLPGVLDPRYADQYEGLALANSVSVDPHKWLGATIGTGAVFVRDRALMLDSFRQGDSNYLQSAWNNEQTDHSMLDFGEPFGDMGLELSAPARGVEVWAALKEIGQEGLKTRICRHNSMAIKLAELVESHPRLELLAGPNLSICCFRYSDPCVPNLNAFNETLYNRLVAKGDNIPSTTLVEDQFAIRPCFVSPRAHMQQVYDLVDDVVEIGDRLAAQGPSF